MSCFFLANRFTRARDSRVFYSIYMIVPDHWGSKVADYMYKAAALFLYG